MKTSLTTKSLLAIASLAVVISAASAFQSNSDKQTLNANVATQKMQKVVVSAKRMSAEEKLSFDLQNSAMQTIVISAKRLTAEQKIAMDAQERAEQTMAAKPVSSARNTAIKG
nr:hypothetical protein [uncultured Undibacterium sp.]